MDPEVRNPRVITALLTDGYAAMLLVDVHESWGWMATVIGIDRGHATRADAIAVAEQWADAEGVPCEDATYHELPR